MTKIERDLKKWSKEHFDLIIVGGGIYGIMLSLEAARRNLRSLVLEKNDFINATTLNHLRTIHGGLGYLQSLDIHRFQESVGERKWFLQHFPEFVRPIPCLMPFYGNGLQRGSFLRVTLLLNDILSIMRNYSLRKDQRIPNAKILSSKHTKEMFPGVDEVGLKGSALWYDAGIDEYQRLIIELLKSAVTSGSIALNYACAKKLLKGKNKVTGVQVADMENREEYEFKTSVVINATGPWCRELATLFDRDYPPLFKKRLLLWNVLFNREALSDYALGLSPLKNRGRSYFFYPWKNRLLVGNGELFVGDTHNETKVPAETMATFINNINILVPSLNLTEKDIQRVYAGILPAKLHGRMPNRELILDHSKVGGPNGFFSVSGVKFSTSRLVADKILNRIFPKTKKVFHIEILERMDRQSISFDFHWEPNNAMDLNLLKEIVENESVVHLSDLILRRTSLGDFPERAIKILPKIRSLFNWDDKRWEEEVNSLKNGLIN
jgi:glycerol-3-phosphate dehydrogenase